MLDEPTEKDDVKKKPPFLKRSLSLYSSIKKWQSNKLMSLFALLISTGTFITFAYQNHLIQKQQFRSVLPYLMINKSIGYDDNDQLRFTIQIFNNGIGPAFIDGINISYNDKNYNSVSEFFMNGIYAVNPIDCGRTDLIEGYAIPTGQMIPILYSNDSIAYQVLDSVFQHVRLEITYSSLYDETWSVVYGDVKSHKPKKLTPD